MGVVRGEAAPPPPSERIYQSQFLLVTYEIFGIKTVLLASVLNNVDDLGNANLSVVMLIVVFTTVVLQLEKKNFIVR